jgi:ribonuclease-3
MGDGTSGSDAGPAATDDAVAALERRLGMRIADRATALAALTHKSYVNEHRGEGLADNERLEFLGDAVIDLAVSHRLMERFPGAREGDLSKMRAAVVDEQGLSEMARGLDLGSLLRLGRGEELTGGRGKASLLADAMEAVVAAVFLGSGLDPVLTLVDRFLGDAFARASAGTLDRDFKTQLQELAQSRLRASPRYRVIAERGPDHEKTFEVEMDLRGEVLGRGCGRSKKDAEQAAAKLALDELGRRFAPENEPAATPRDAALQPATAEAEPAAPVTAEEPEDAVPPSEPEPEPEQDAAPEPAEPEAPRHAPAKRAPARKPKGPARRVRSQARARTPAGKAAARGHEPAAKARKGSRPKR